MENKRKALGIGLEQLFMNEPVNINKMEEKIVKNTDKKDVIEINIKELRRNPYQPRIKMDIEKLQELSDSIKTHGVLQPIIVKKSIKGYEIVAGERRTKASEMAGFTTIPAIIKDFTDEEMMEIALLENVQRENLSAIEEAKAYANMLMKLKITQDELSKKVGKSRSYITNIIGLLRLPAVVQELVINKKISMGHARVLSKIEDENKIKELAKLVVNEDISVRKLEELASIGNIKRTVPLKKKERKYKDIENIMREHIGTMVKITDKKIEIPYDSEKDLERILEILKINMKR